MAVFFWKRTTAGGAVTSILTGTVVTIGWQLLQQYGSLPSTSPIAQIDAVYPALAISVGCLIVVSLLTPAPVAEPTARLAAH